MLAVLTFALYVPSFSNNFVDYDDHHYVTQNKVVQKGLTREGVVWAFTTTKFANWLPVTWLSHELDCQLWVSTPAGTTRRVPCCTRSTPWRCSLPYALDGHVSGKRRWPRRCSRSTR